MSKQQIKQLLEQRLSEDGLVETGVKGVQIFKVTEATACAPAVYEPTIVAILSGSKEAILNGTRYSYDCTQYLCCPIPLPVEAGTPNASVEEPLLGVFISIDTTMMSDLAIKLDSTSAVARPSANTAPTQSFTLASWDDTFTDALLRVLELGESQTDTELLGDNRLRELFYAVLTGEAGGSARHAFGIGNEIARTIQYLSANLTTPISIEDLASRAGMSRAVFHRKFKQTTTMSPIQFVKSMRLNRAAMKIAAGSNVSTAAMEVGYASSSQFSREFKRVYGQSPKQWRS